MTEREASGAQAGPALIVGLTGGIGSGKSRVASRFEVLGVPVIDADALAREVVEPGEPGLAEVAAAFGEQVLDAEGRLDRAALRLRVFADPDERRKLERILHPRIRERMRARLGALTAPYSVVEIPLLVESGQRDMVDRVLVVDASDQTRIARTIARDGTDREDVRRIIEAQADRNTRLAAADDVLDNEGDPQALDAAVDCLHQRYLEIVGEICHAQGGDERIDPVSARPPGTPPGAPARQPPMVETSHSTAVIYEQPLSERVRSFMRLEFLFERAARLIDDPDPWSSRTLIEVIIDVMAILSRTDLKKELINELERQSTTMEALARNPNVDQSRLTEVLSEVKGLLVTLRGLETVPGQELRNDEMLSAVRQRSSMPAGTCDFDLPAYHYWLQSPAEDRGRVLNQWLGAFDLLREAVTSCLRLVRQSALTSQETAARGFFQKTLETSSPCQMIRVTLPRSATLYPEISAGRHRFTIRFMRPSEGAARPVQTDEDIEFGLQRCII